MYRKISEIADKYSICRSTVYAILKRMSKFPERYPDATVHISERRQRINEDAFDDFIKYGAALEAHMSGIPERADTRKEQYGTA